jgi:hypothetical protein
MWRLLIFFAVLCQSDAVFVAVTTSGVLVEIDAAAYFSYTQHQSDYVQMYLPAQETCMGIFDAQFVQSDSTYRIDDWYYKPVGTTGVSTHVSIVDLEAFAARAYQVGVWADAPDCNTIWTRISTLLLRDVFSSITLPVGSELATVKYGVLGAYYCEESVCTSAQLTEVLKVVRPNQIMRIN